MKDTVITATRKKTEIMVFLLCFSAAFILNIVSVIVYQTRWIELFTQLHIVLIVALVFYFVLLAFRLLFLLVQIIFFR